MWKTFTKGIIKENPVLVLLLGLCPTLATTTMVRYGLGMGVTTMLALTLTNIIIAMLKNIIPEKVRIPCYIVVIAGVVTIVGFLVEAYIPDINEALGVFIPLITVNCILLGRAEAFASKNGVLASCLDGLGMGVGFTLALLVISSIRELLACGTWFDIPITSGFMDRITIFGTATGAFFVFGGVVALVNWLSSGRILKNKSEIGCQGCPSAEICRGEAAK